MDQLREGPGTGSRRGRFASQYRHEDPDVALTHGSTQPPRVAAEVARALADKLRVRDLPSVTDPAPDEKYGLRLYMSPRRRPFTITAHHDGSFTVVKESTSQSGNPYRTDALATKRFRFADEPTTEDIAREIADTIDSMRWWS